MGSRARQVRRSHRLDTDVDGLRGCPGQSAGERGFTPPPVVAQPTLTRELETHGTTRSAWSRTSARTASRSRGSVILRDREEPGTSEAAPPTRPRRSRATSTGGRRAACRRASAPAGRARVASGTRPGRRPFRRRRRHGAQLRRDRLEPLAGAFEIGDAKISRAAGRPARRVRQPHSELEKPPVLARLEETGREAGSVEQTPEVVPRVRERRARSCAHPARVDSAEDESDAAGEDVLADRACQEAKHPLLLGLVLGLGESDRTQRGISKRFRRIAVVNCNARRAVFGSTRDARAPTASRTRIASS